MKPTKVIEKLKRLERLICNVDNETLAINKDLWKKTLNEAANLIEGLLPRPIEEAPKDELLLCKTKNGKFIVGIWNDETDYISISSWSFCAIESIESFVSLLSLKNLMESGE